MKRIEYKIDLFKWEDHKYGANMLEYLNEQGRDGWVYIRTNGNVQEVFNYFEQHWFWREVPE